MPNKLQMIIKQIVEIKIQVILLSSLCLCLLTSHYKLTLLIDKNKIFQLFCLNIECREIISIFQRNFFHHFKILLRFFPEVKHTGVCQTCALIQYFFSSKIRILVIYRNPDSTDFYGICRLKTNFRYKCLIKINIRYQIKYR